MKSRRRKLRVYYLSSGELEWAYIETIDGHYVCEVERCLDESKRHFHQRARSLQEALEYYQYPMVLLGDNA